MTIVAIGLMSFAATGKTTPINLDAISFIESSNDPNAFNESSQAAGLFQITPICLAHYNDTHSTEFTVNDLFTPSRNREIAEWYFWWLSDRCDSVEEILIAYNFGYGNLRKYRAGKVKLPRETRSYIAKYNALTEREV